MQEVSHQLRRRNKAAAACFERSPLACALQLDAFQNVVTGKVLGEHVGE